LRPRARGQPSSLRASISIAWKLFARSGRDVPNSNQKIQERSCKRRHVGRFAWPDSRNGKLKTLEPKLAFGNVGNLSLVLCPADGIHLGNIAVAALPRKNVPGSRL